jgi:zinc protease
MQRFLPAGLLALVLAVVCGPVLAADMPDIDIEYEKFTLDNGLTVVVHEDRKAPIVAVSIWYHVGSKNEPQGKTGFAHLFEHLMFNGSENYDGEYFEPFEQVGATGMNGTTWFDRTNYFQTVPTPALDMALWMESDRMGHLLGAVTQENSTTRSAWCRTRSARATTSPTARSNTASSKACSRRDTPIATARSARWKT